MLGLFGEEFDIVVTKPKVKDLVRQVSEAEQAEINSQKVLKSKKLTLRERVNFIIDKVITVLGKQRNNTVVIKTRAEFSEYIDKAIASGYLSVDTETNNSLDPVTCKLMGLCLHYPGGKQAYIPVNHIELVEDDKMSVWGFAEQTEKKVGKRLPDQLTEKDCQEELRRVIDAKTFIIMHNGKFDYEVIKCTCNIEVVPNWDTMIGARLLNENELAGLKNQYVTKIDPSQEKYDIENLFEDIQYAIVPPEIFALYAATDSMMTTALYQLQIKEFEKPGNERLYWVFKNIEMPIVVVTAEMELTGVCVDVDFGERLKIKYNKQLEEVDTKIETEMQRLAPTIREWRKSKEANAKSKMYQPKKTKLSLAEIEIKYPLVDSDGKRYKLGKTLNEQLADPVNMASPVQLAILLYDVLGFPSVSKKSPRGTGEDELELLAEKTGDALCNLIVERRGIVKLITTYIDVIPDLSKHWPDGRIRFHLNSLGTDTGRYSSGGKLKFIENDEPVVISGINIQNIPSHNPEIRLLFKAAENNRQVELTDNFYELDLISEVETINGWKYGKDLKIGDTLVTDEGIVQITNIILANDKYLLYI